MIEEATKGLIETGVIAIVLCAGLIVMYRHFSKETKSKDEIIKAKDKMIMEMNKELTDLVSRDIEATTKFNTTLEHLIKMIDRNGGG